MTDAEIDAALACIDGSGQERERAPIRRLRANVADFPALMHRLYQEAGRYQVRAACVYYVFSEARAPSAIALGQDALFDRSRVVRYRAAQLLSFAQDRGSLPVLKDALGKIDDPDSQDDFKAAIAAITEGNRHLFRDRYRTGRIKMELARPI